MESKQRVVITGLGVAAPIGLGIEAFWDALLQGRSGIRRLEAFRREGKEFQRFKVSPGGQSEKSGGKYPFVQELRIEVRDDEHGVSKKKKSKRSRRR